LGDVAIIHHVDQATRRREDQRFLVCWAFCHNPSLIPQLLFLTLIDRHADPRLDGQPQFSRPRNVKQGHTFMMLIHTDFIEGLSFYQRPAEQLSAEGRVQFREFRWIPGHLDGDMDDDDVKMAPRFYRPSDGLIRRPRDDDDADRDRGRPCRRELLGSVSRWFDQRRSIAPTSERDHRGRWFRGEPSQHRRMPGRSSSPPPCRKDFSLDEKRALCGMWSDFGRCMDNPADKKVAQENLVHKASHAIVIEPTLVFDSVEPQSSLNTENNFDDVEFKQHIPMSDAIMIIP
jgi:hypothetical protein